jgi:membrane protein implicated in regulation of membrane protease activity
VRGRRYVAIATGVVLLLVSTALAGITYTSSNLRGGLDAAAIERAIAAEADGQTAEFEKQLLRSYARWIAYNARMTAVNDMLATVTVLLVIVSFVYVGVGLVAGFLGVGLTVTVPVFVVMTLVLTWLSRLIYHMDHLAPQPGEADIFEGVMISKGASREEGLVALREMLRGPGKD